MNVDKRPRPSSSKIPGNAAYIDLCSSDEEPPRKRQKSVTPVTQRIGHQQSAKPSSIVVDHTQTPAHSQAAQSSQSSSNAENKTSTKPSPWKNRPSWQKISTAPEPSSEHNVVLHQSSGKKDSRHTTEGIGRAIDREWTTGDNKRLRELSINRERSNEPRSQEKTPEVVEEQRRQLVNHFKLGPSSALKFNPNNGNVPSSRSGTTAQVTLSARVKTEDDAKTNGASKFHLQSQSPGFRPQFVSAVKLVTPRTNVETKVSTNSTPTRTAPPSSTESLTSTKLTPWSSAQQQQQQRQYHSKISVNVPLTDAAKFKQERKQLQDKLKEGPEYAKRHPDEVARLLNLTGFSTEFPANLEEEKFQKAAQPKKRRVDRSRLDLDFGQPRESGLIPGPTAQNPPRFVHPRDQAKAILTARFAEPFRPPLTFSNTINDRRLNGKFQFISDYILRKGVKATKNFRQLGCSCVERCDASCTCLRRSFRDDKQKIRQYEQVEQYERRPDGLVVLRNDFIRRHMIDATNGIEEPMERVEISECNESCPCGDSCLNRVVQKGRTVPLDIFETRRCGFGVRSSANLVRGQFIEVYLGEVITENELVRREEAAEAGSTSYIYSLDWFSSQQAYHIDGENFGSAMRFVNHSCDPNAGTFPVLNNESTKQLHYVAFFALKDIPAGTEITIDYTPQAAGERYELNDGDEEMEKCYCGASNCRQMLWLPGKERKSRKKLVHRSFE